MAEKEVVTPAVPAVEAEPVVVEVPKEKTAAEVIAEATPEPKKPETVGLDKFLSEKAGRKAAEDAVKVLQAKIDAGATEKEVASDIKAIGTKYDVSPEFLKELADTIEARTEQKFASRLSPLEEKEKAEKLDKAFGAAYDSAMAEMSEFAKVVNKDVIKQLSLAPENRNKTFTQIIEDTYGSAVPGKRTIEATKPGGGKEPEPLNIDRARKDPTYFDEVMANPKLKAEYNKQMLEKGF